MQFSLATETWDLFLDETGNISLRKSETLDELVDLICQRVKCRLQTFRGECYLDRNMGVPYFKEVMKKNPDLGKVRSLLAATIVGVEGVKSLEKLKIKFDASTREYKVIFRALADNGNEVNGEI
jgi:hypothetical protein